MKKRSLYQWCHVINKYRLLNQEGSLYLVLLSMISLIVLLIPLIIDIGSFDHSISRSRIDYEQQRCLLEGMMYAAIYQSVMQNPITNDAMQFTCNEKQWQGVISTIQQQEKYVLKAQLTDTSNIIRTMHCNLESKAEHVIISQWSS